MFIRDRDRLAPARDKHLFIVRWRATQLGAFNSSQITTTKPQKSISENRELWHICRVDVDLYRPSSDRKLPFDADSDEHRRLPLLLL